jgi:hypothetical protein
MGIIDAQLRFEIGDLEGIGQDKHSIIEGGQDLGSLTVPNLRVGPE